jgi:flagellar protein FlaG
VGFEIITHNPEYKTGYLKGQYPGVGRAGIRNTLPPGRDDAYLELQYGTYVDAVEKLRHAGNLFNKRLDFRVDEATNRIVVKVIDTETDKVIKEIPPEQLLHLAAKIQEMIGLLVDEER